ncbi:ABC transporter B family member 21-like protein [Tanacetum coccineum]
MSPKNNNRLTELIIFQLCGKWKDGRIFAVLLTHLRYPKPKAPLSMSMLVGVSGDWEDIVLALIPIIGANAYAQMKYGKGFTADAKKMYEAATQIASDVVGSIRTVASIRAEGKLVIEYSNKCECPKKKGIQRVSQSSSFAPDTGKAMSSAVSVFAFLDRKSEIDPYNESRITLDTFKGEIYFRHVSFKYPTRPDVEIFRDLCLTIQSGKTVTLVGESGSGKSTVISLLQRFYNPDSGAFTLDRVKLQKFQLKWLRLQMGLVSQEPVLFNDTIRANISYGKHGQTTETEIISASELANAHEFVCGLHQGYDIMVGARQYNYG